MKTGLIFAMLFVLILLPNLSFSQTYQGPAVGSVSSGGSVNTGTFLKSTVISLPRERGTRNLGSLDKTPVYLDFANKNISPQSVYIEDKFRTQKSLNISSPSILLQSFQGLTMGNFIPPDPHIAVGPTHIIATVNTSFGIWDKDGNLIKVINPDTWFQSLVPNPDCFDPQIMYDHFDKKWIMTWDSQNDTLQRAHLLIAISADSIPLGTWYIWALPENRNGSDPVANWADYPQIGFDANAIYINSRSWTFGDTAKYQYNKIRIINKNEIYNNPGGSVSWKDIWDITDPQVSTQSGTYKPDVIIPAITFGSESAHYFLHTPRFGGNFISLYKIIDPIGNPSLSRVNIIVDNYGYSPNANQLGGGATLISSNESGMKSAPIYRDGFLWGVHSIANPVFPQNSAVKYYKINVSNSNIVESAVLGASGYWYIFPNLTVDKDQNVAITYSRSGTDEYCGAFYTTRLKNDPPGLSDSKVLQEGKGNYVVTFGSTRNRWGDYMGISLDPSDENNIWMFTEYVEAKNIWGTRVGEIRMVPLPGVRLYSSNPLIDFGNVELSYSSDTITTIISNYGTENLEISNIPVSNGPFHMISNFSFPINLASFDSILVKFIFTPTDTGTVSTSFNVTSNDPLFTSFELTGKGYVIKPAVQNILYSSSGTNNGANLASLNITSGTGSNIGSLLNTDVSSLSIHPKSKVIYGLNSTFKLSKLLKVNAELGDAYSLHEYPIGELESIAFDTSGAAYVAAKNGNLYTLDLTTGQMDSFARAPIQISSIAFNPIDNQLWAAILVSFGAGKDRIYKLDKITGDTTRVGQTGFNITTNGITFDENGNLFGVTGSTTQINNLISINTTTGVGTLIGATGLKHLTDIAYLAVKPTSVETDKTTLPSQFSLRQNYPNPFNPLTTIEFALPVSAKVKLKVYNLLGQTVKVIFDGVKDAGYHKLNWNSEDASGKSVSSGIYFYELSAAGFDGREFNQMKKMILMK